MDILLSLSTMGPTASILTKAWEKHLLPTRSMIDFLQTLVDPTYRFLLYALLGGIFASISFGIVGTYVVTRRITGISGAIAHCVLGGIGIALYLQRVWGWTFCDPFLGAIIAAVLSAFIIGLIGRNRKEREDTLIGAIWAVGMAIGLIFFTQTPGFIDPMIYLFGNILLLSEGDLYIILGLDALVIFITVLFYQPLLAICFDEEEAKLRGLPILCLYSILLILTAFTIVLLIRVVGIVLVIALLTLPAAIAGKLSHKLSQMMILASLFCILFVISGLYLSYDYNLPSGPTIGLTAAAAYIILAVSAWIRKHFFKKPICSEREKEPKPN